MSADPVERPLRIVMLIAGFAPATEGGTEKQCRLLAAELVKLGHSVDVLTRVPGVPGTPRREVLDGVRVARLGIGHPFSAFVRSLRRAKKPAASAGNFRALEKNGAQSSRRWKFSPVTPLLWLEHLVFLSAVFLRVWSGRGGWDVLHVHESHWLAGFGVWLGRACGLPVVAKEASFPVFMAAEVPVPGRRCWERLRLQASWFAQTDAAAAALAAAGVDAGRITVVPNGVHVPAEAASPAGSRAVLYVGNLHQGAEWKGFDVLFAAWVQVAQACPGARLNVAGAGDAAPWKSFLTEHGVADTVRFCGAVADPSALYSGAALLVLPSRREGLPNAAIEAQAWGLPVVASDIAGCRAVVRGGETGLVVPAGDADQTAAAVVALLDDAGMRARMGRAGRARAAACFSFSHVAGQVALCYRRLLHEQPAGPEFGMKHE